MLTWTMSPETNAWYFVYRSTNNNFAGPFTRLTSNPIISCNYTDASPPSGQKLYEVRALNGVSTGSGSYTNVSEGVFVISN